jgi:hypothetical protein
MFTLPKRLLRDWQADMSRRNPLSYSGWNTAEEVFDYLSTHSYFPGNIPFDLTDESLTKRWTGRDKFYLRSRKMLWIDPDIQSEYLDFEVNLLNNS